MNVSDYGFDPSKKMFVKTREDVYCGTLVDISNIDEDYLITPSSFFVLKDTFYLLQGHFVPADRSMMWIPFSNICEIWQGN